MNNKNIKRICRVASISVLTTLLITVNGCSSRPDKQILDNTSIDSNQTVQIETTEKNIQTEDNSIENSASQTTESGSETNETNEIKETEIPTIIPAATREIYIYTINQDTLGVESVVALVPADSENTPQLIIDQVTDSLADNLVEIGVDEVTTQKDTVIVSFKSDQPPLTNVGSALEKTILDAVAQSLVDNLKEYPKVIFRVEGKPYSSGHYSFGLDQIYLDNSKTK